MDIAIKLIALCMVYVMLLALKNNVVAINEEDKQ